MKRVIILILFLLLQGADLFASKPPLTTIEVTDKFTGEVIPFASVAILNDSVVYSTALTDTSGRCTFMLKPGAEYAMRVNSIGYEGYIGCIKAHKGVTTIHLKPVEFIAAVEIVVFRKPLFERDICGGGWGCYTRSCFFREYLLVDNYIDTLPEDETVAPFITKCYPNPSNGIAYIEPGCPTNEIMVLNMSGQLISTIPALGQEKVQVDIRGNAPGIYLLSFMCNGKLETSKLVLTNQPVNSSFSLPAVYPFPTTSASPYSGKR